MGRLEFATACNENDERLEGMLCPHLKAGLNTCLPRLGPYKGPGMNQGS